MTPVLCDFDERIEKYWLIKKNTLLKTSSQFECWNSLIDFKKMKYLFQKKIDSWENETWILEKAKWVPLKYALVISTNVSITYVDVNNSSIVVTVRKWCKPVTISTFSKFHRICVADEVLLPTIRASATVLYLS